MTAPAAENLAAARAALAAAEAKTGVRRGEDRGPRLRIVPGTEVHAPVTQVQAARPLAELVEGGRLATGAASVVLGSSNMLLALLAASQQAGEWIAFVAAPTTGFLAAAEHGIALERVVTIPDTQGRDAAVIAALLDGMTYVVVGAGARLTAGERRSLLARARERDAGLVSVREWEQAAVRLRSIRATWTGHDAGLGYIRRCVLDVDRNVRGRTTQWTVEVPNVADDPTWKAEGVRRAHQAEQSADASSPSTRTGKLSRAM